MKKAISIFAFASLLSVQANATMILTPVSIKPILTVTHETQAAGAVAVAVGVTIAGSVAYEAASEATKEATGKTPGGHVLSAAKSIKRGFSGESSGGGNQNSTFNNVVSGLSSIFGG